MPERKNAFDLLRLILAGLVVVSHSYLLGGYGAEPLYTFSKGQISMGDIAVMGFFALSGYLISSSFGRSPLVFRFMLNRVLRIFPGFWVCLVIVGFIIAPGIFYLSRHTLNGFRFWGDDSAFSYFYSNMLLPVKQWSIPGVLDGAAYQGSLNGSTWSLFPEMQCYFLVLGAGFLGLFNQNKKLLLLLAGFVYIVYVINLVSPVKYGPTILTLSNAFKVYTTFICGMVLYAYGSRINIDGKGYIFLGLLSLITLKFGGFLIIAPIIIAVFCVKLFSTFKVSLKSDISYGLYIYAFPIQHLIYVAFVHKISLLVFIVLSLAATGLLGYLSFKLVEKPFLKMKRSGKNNKIESQNTNPS